jgi:hypothetical protein
MAAAKVGNRGRPLLRRAELCQELQGARFALAEELVLEVEPGAARIRLAVQSASERSNEVM